MGAQTVHLCLAQMLNGTFSGLGVRGRNLEEQQGSLEWGSLSAWRVLFLGFGWAWCSSVYTHRHTPTPTPSHTRIYQQSLTHTHTLSHTPTPPYSHTIAHTHTHTDLSGWSRFGPSQPTHQPQTLASDSAFVFHVTAWYIWGMSFPGFPATSLVCSGPVCRVLNWCFSQCCFAW